MLEPVMATARKPTPPPASAPAKEQFNVRLSPEMLGGLDRWLAELNEGRRLPLRRSDLVRGVLDWAIEKRPDFERLAPAAPAKGGRR